MKKLVVLGAVGSQPLRIHIPRSGGRDTYIEVPVAPGERLPPMSVLEEARARLKKTVDAFVPSTTSAASWVSEFEAFAKKRAEETGQSLAECWPDFVALVYFRTTLKVGTPGYLMISSALTYLRYVTLRYKGLAHAPCFRAVETEAGSIGSLKKAPTADEDLTQKVVQWMQKGPDEKLKVRSAAWLQCSSGGRSIDVARVRGGCLTFKDKNLHCVDWRWTKSIKRGRDAKAVFILPQVQAALGPPPFSEQQWKAWAGQDLMGMPFSKVSNATTNEELAGICQGYDRKLTTTSLRDIYNRIVAAHCDNDPVKMMQYTPHLNAKSISSSYLSGRSTAQKCAPTKPETKNVPKKTNAPVAKKATSKKASAPAVKKIAPKK